jgi:hypothetical protein
VEKGYYVFQYIDEQFRYFICEDESELLWRLTRQPSGFSPIILDQQVQVPGLFLTDLLAYNLADQIQVFYHASVAGYQLLVLDEYGSMLQFVLPPLQEEVLQSSLARCLQGLITNRQMTDAIGAEAGILDARIFRVTTLKTTSDGLKAAGEAGSKLSLKVLSKIQDIAAYELHVQGLIDVDRCLLDISLTGQDLPYKEFAYREYGEQQFDAMLHFVKHQANFNARLPFQIVDIGLSEQEISLSLSQAQGLATLDVFRVFAQSQQALFVALEKQGLV